jgi:hypothetical protein
MVTSETLYFLEYNEAEGKLPQRLELYTNLLSVIFFKAAT